jgi:hypothetical protein
MRKLSIWLGVGLIIAAFTADLSGQMKKIFPRGERGDLIVQSIHIVLPSGTDCILQWSATILNKGLESQTDRSIIVQAYQVSSNGQTKPAGSRPLGKISPGETITTQLMPFDRWGYATQFRVVLSGSGGEIAQSTIELPAEPIAHSFSLENFHLTASGSGYEVTLKNPTQNGFADLGFQTYASKKDPPPADNAWLGAGGWGIPCLAGQSQYIKTHSLEPGTKYLKIEIYRRGSRILREVYDLRGMVQIKTVENSLSQMSDLVPHLAQIEKNLPPPGSLIVKSIKIVLPSGTDCTLQWSATILNKGVKSQKSITVQAYQVSSDGQTKPAGSRPLGTIGPGETITTQPVPFNRWGYATLFRVVLLSSGWVIAEDLPGHPRRGPSTIELPAEPIAHSLSLENFHLTASGYEVTLKNPTQNGVADLGFQTYASKKDPPPADKAWLGAGGWGIPCLAGQSQYVKTHSLEPGTKYLKIEIYRRGSRILREVYDLRGMVPIKAIYKPMSQIIKRQ